MAVQLSVGTRKGLFLLRGEPGDGAWELEGPLLSGWSVNHALVDPRDGTLYAATNNWVYGGTFHRSRDLGKTWERTEQLGLPEESGLKLAATWHVEPGRSSEPGTLWLGGDPGVLFRSDDAGTSWAVNEAGAFRSDDGGESWTPINANVAADFMPEKYPEVGQCVHKLLVHPNQGDRLWQQNHCGVYRSDDRGDSWERLDANGLPSGFGFPLALDANDPDVAYVIPEESAENRVTSDGRLGVYRTADGGVSWELWSDGLPEQAWLAVLREGFGSDANGLYFGTQSGSVWAAPHSGGWTEAARDLPPILSVEASEWR